MASFKNRKHGFLPFIQVLFLIFTLIFGSAGVGFASCQTQFGYIPEVAFPNLTFSQPVGIIFDAESSRAFVVEQVGVIKVFENQSNVTTANVFLDISSRVLFGGEQGLLGLALHPNYNQNGFFYVNYMVDSPRRTIISRFTATANNPNQADLNSELVLFEVEQPFSNHNGGQLAFGPDGYLYIGLGDGGLGGDPFGNAQNRQVLLGKILRIDVDAPSGGRNYGIPQDNPYAGNTLGFREEIYAYGLRNPWRFSFDSQTGRLWVGDVGQSQREEIDIVQSGRNYGWNIMEGTLCYDPPIGCNRTGLELPVWEYDHSEGFAVIGGYVYHGGEIPDLAGAYVYGDYGSGKIWVLRLNGAPQSTLLIDTTLNIASFGVDDRGELYFTAFDGKVYKLIFIIPEFSWETTLIALLAATLVFVVLFRKQKEWS